MKKRFLFGICVLIIGGIGSLYLFIPNNLIISKIERVRCNENGVFRVIMEDSNWEKCCAATIGDKYSFHLSQKLYKQIEVYFKNKDEIIPGTINIIRLNGPDSAILHWQIAYPTSYNPITRILHYLKALQIKEKMTILFAGMKILLEHPENVYGINPKDEMSKDSTLVATKIVTVSYPGTVEIYGLIKKIRDYISRERVHEVDYPMLHIGVTKDNQFETMVAIAVDRALPGDGPLFFRHFVPYKILTAEVKGGEYTINKGFEQMQQYIQDYQRTVMAIPFQLLITERNIEPDSNRWSTKLVEPIF